MNSEWREVRFADMLEEPVRNGIYKPKQFHGNGAKIVNMGELFAYPRLRDVKMKRLKLTAAEEKRFLLAPGDLIFARRSLTSEGAGKCSIVMDIGETTTFESSIIRARPHADRASSLFLYYLFASPVGRYALGTIKREVAVSGITGTDLSNLVIRLPPAREQRTIAAVLSALDDKIELNRRLNETLEASARALFRDWFVDFGPTRAKAEGRPAYLAPDLWSLFPDRLGDDGVPEGWEVSSLGELYAVSIGRTPPRKEQHHFVNSGLGVPWLSIKTMGSGNAFLFETEENLTHDSVKRFKVPIVKTGTVMVSFKLTVGRVGIAGVDMATNEAIAHLNDPNDEAPSVAFTFFWMKEFDYNRLGSTSSIATAVNSQSIRSMPILVPSPAVLEAFDEIVQPHLQGVRQNLAESRTLAETRDALLPKLMSGELRVRDAEALAA